MRWKIDHGEDGQGVGRHIERSPSTDLGRFIRRRREQLGLTVQVAAAKANVDYGEWLKIERGDRKPMWSTIQRIAFAIDVSMGDFPTDTQGLTPSEAKTNAAKLLAELPSEPVNTALGAIIPLLASDNDFSLFREVMAEFAEIPPSKRNILVRQLMPIAEKVGKAPQKHHETTLIAVLDYVRFYKRICESEAADIFQTGKISVCKSTDPGDPGPDAN